MFNIFLSRIREFENFSMRDVIELNKNQHAFGIESIRMVLYF